MPDVRCPMSDAHCSILSPTPNQVSPACYYGVPTSRETLDLLAGSWYFFAGVVTLTLTPTLTLTL